MTTVLPSLAPVGANLRDAMPVTLSTAPRPVTPVSAVETARAPRPVDSVNPSEILRNQKQSERPVGPPPAFEINVLQDIRARLADPAKAEPAKAEPAEAPPKAEEPEQPPTERADPDPDIDAETPAEPAAETPQRPALVGAEPEAPYQLDMKV